MAAEKRRLRAVEFYAGVGGFHYGLLRSQAPADVVASFDLNPIANTIYAHNFPNTAHLNRNICGLNAGDLDALRADIFHLSPPCQPFTRQGLRRDKEDRRTDSFFHLMSLLPQLTHPPNYLLMENVQGFEISHTRAEFTETLQRAGYRYQEFLLSPTQFGVPNSRLRYYLLAMRSPKEFPLDFSEQPCRDAIALAKFVQEESITYSDSSSSPTPSSLSVYLEPITDSDTQRLLVPTHILNKCALALDIVQPSSTNCCCFTRGYGNYAVGTGSVLQHCQTKEDLHSTFKIFKERLKHEEAAKDTTAEVVEMLTPLKLRYLSPREVANLMCFPADFSIPEDISLRQSYKVLGNSLNILVVSVLLKYLLNDMLLS